MPRVGSVGPAPAGGPRGRRPGRAWTGTGRRPTTVVRGGWSRRARPGVSAAVRATVTSSLADQDEDDAKLVMTGRCSIRGWARFSSSLSWSRAAARRSRGDALSEEMNCSGSVPSSRREGGVGVWTVRGGSLSAPLATP